METTTSNLSKEPDLFTGTAESIKENADAIANQNALATLANGTASISKVEKKPKNTKISDKLIEKYFNFLTELYEQRNSGGRKSLTIKGISMKHKITALVITILKKVGFYKKGVWVGEPPSKELAKRVIRRVRKAQLQYAIKASTQCSITPTTPCEIDLYLLQTHCTSIDPPTAIDNVIKNEYPILKTTYGKHQNVELTEDEYKIKLISRYNKAIATVAIDLLSDYKHKYVEHGYDWYYNNKYGDYSAIKYYGFIDKANEKIKKDKKAILEVDPFDEPTEKEITKTEENKEPIININDYDAPIWKKWWKELKSKFKI